MTVFRLSVSIHLNQTGSEYGGSVFPKRPHTVATRTVFRLSVSIHLNQTGSEDGGRVFIRNVRTVATRTVFRLSISIHLNQTDSEDGGRVFIRNVRTQSPRDTVRTPRAVLRPQAAGTLSLTVTNCVYSEKAARLRKYYFDEMHAPPLKELRAVFTCALAPAGALPQRAT